MSLMAYLINLDRSPERLATSSEMLKAAGIAFERIPAVDGRKMTPDDLRVRCSRLKFFLANARRVKISEVACALSHTLCWKKLLASDEPRAVVFEDDVSVDREKYEEALRQIERDDDGTPAVWLLHHRNLVKDPGRPSVVRLLGTPHEALTCWGTESYVLNRAAAEKLLELQTPVRYVADAWSTYARRGIDVRVVFPTSCKVRNIGSEIERKTTGRAGWKWYLAFGRLKFRVAFHLDNLAYWFRTGGWKVVAAAGLIYALVVVDVLVRMGGVRSVTDLGWWYYIFKRALITALPLMALPFFLRRATRIVAPFVFGWIFLVEALEVFVRLNFHMMIKGDVVSILMSTSWREVWEFCSIYAGWGTVGLLLAFLTAWVAGLVAFARLRWPVPRRRWVSYAVGASLLAAFVALGGNLRWAVYYETPCDCVKRYAFYRDLADMLKHPDFGKYAVAAHRVPVTVIVIGESATREHWQLYGYGRETTPHICARRDELMVFDDLLAPWYSTQEALRLLLTRATHRDLERTKMTMLQLLEAAGYRTVLLSAQTHGGTDDTIDALLFSGCSRRVYLDDIKPPIAGYDERLLPFLDEELRTAKTDKRPLVVFLHLYGSHMPFEQRFPPEAAHFSSAKRQRQSQTTHDELVNRYDDSLRYTDELLDQVLGRLEALKAESLFVYFSDHGDTPDSHRWRYNPDPALWKVPFVLWCSPTYRTAFPDRVAAIEKARHLPLQSDRLMDGLLGLLGVTCEGCAKDDFLSPDFDQTVPRRIHDGVKFIDVPMGKSGQWIVPNKENNP